MKTLKQFIISPLIFIFVSIVVFSQDAPPQKLPLNFWFYQNVTLSKTNIHTSFKPLIYTDIHNNYDSLYENNNRSNYFQQTHLHNRSFVSRKLFYENLIQIDSNNFKITVDPLINLSLGKEQEDTSNTLLYTNTRGYLIKGNIGNNFAFNSTFKENQSRFPTYVAQLSDSLSVVPGQGRTKSFKDNAYDYAQATGSVMYSHKGKWLIQMGNDKFFIGNGYRSLLLSDAAFSYPYIGTTIYFFKKKIQYNKYYADLIHLERRPETNSPEALFYRKGMNFHYIDINITRWWQIGIFESIIINKMDSTGSTPFNFISLNPIPFVPLLIYGFNGNNNVSLGLNSSINLPFNTKFYGQFYYAGKKNNIEKWAYQIGIKSRLFQWLSAGAEYNASNPYTYLNNDPKQAYAHYNQSLGHPLGGNFSEILGWLNFKYKRLFAQFKLNNINQNNAGSNVLLSENATVVNYLNNKNVLSVKTGVIVNPKTNMVIEIGVQQWNYSQNNLQNSSTYYYFGIKTNITNNYYDF